MVILDQAVAPPLLRSLTPLNFAFRITSIALIGLNGLIYRHEVQMLQRYRAVILYVLLNYTKYIIAEFLNLNGTTHFPMITRNGILMVIPLII